MVPVSGENNKIIIAGREITENENRFIRKFGKITIEGNNNTVELHDISKLNCDILIAGNNNRISIGKFRRQSAVKVRFFWGDNKELTINDSIYIGDCEFVMQGHNTKIHVGEDCLFSIGINIWNTDGHPVYSFGTNERINEEQDVIIGDHVWIGKDVHVSKGTIIPPGCAVGTKSFVNKKFTKENCVIAGVPARVVKENIRWEY